MTQPRVPLSPRLAALQHALASGSAAAQDRFWHESEAEGTPLLEAIDGDSSHRLVTFVYRAHRRVDRVEISSALAGRGRVSEPMIHLPGTNLRYKTYRVSAGLRTEYQYSVNGEPQPDPFNSRIVVFPADKDAFLDSFVPESWFEVPPALTPAWMAPRPGDVEGRLERVHMQSEMLGNERPLSIYTPLPGGSRGQPEHLLILFDRWIYAHVLPTAAVIDHLIAERSIPPLLVVMVGLPNAGARKEELACSAPFTDFLARELLPWICQRFHLTPHPSRTVVGGFSLGGLAAAYTGLRHSDVFGKVFCQSGSFYWKPDAEEEYEWLARHLVASPRLPLQWYLCAGLLETRTSEGARPNLLLANRHLRDVLQARGYALSYTEFNGGHNFVWQLPGLAEGLRVLLGP